MSTTPAPHSIPTSESSSKLPELWRHQKLAIERAKGRDHFALWCEMGTGKTRTQINIIDNIRDDKIARGEGGMCVVVICPLVVMENWEAEIKKYSRGKAAVFICKGKEKDKVKTLSEVQTYMGFPPHRFPVWVIINYEALINKTIFTNLQGLPPEAIVFDEAHKIKNIQSQRTKLCLKLALTAKYRYLMTGTPILNSPMDIFSQFLALDHGSTFGSNIHKFRAKFFYDANHEGPRKRYLGTMVGRNWSEWVPRAGALDIFSREVSRVGSVVKKKDCLDLPPLHRITVPVELSPMQKKHYDEMKLDLITFFAGARTSTASVALVKNLRLQQIVSGHLPTEKEGDEETIIQAFHNTPREEALLELLHQVREGGKKAIVWAAFKHDIKVIANACEKASLRYVLCTGAQSAEEKQHNINIYQHDFDTPIFIGSPGAAGIGINLTVADTMIYFSRSFNLEHDLQSEARNYRGGSEIHESVTRYDIVAKGTIDEVVLKALEKKEKIGDQILLSYLMGGRK